MNTLTNYQLRSRAKDHFDAVGATPGIDQFCSSLDWTLPAHEAFIPDHPLVLLESEHGFVNLARGFNPRIGRYLQPLEASWCLASPFVGPDMESLIGEFAQTCRHDLLDWDLLYLSGIPADSPCLDALVSSFSPEFRIAMGHKTRRYIADISDGFAAFLGRRSPKFRANARRVLRQIDDPTITVDWLDQVPEAEADSVYDRILRVEERSWKGMTGTGILDGGMNTFYRIMIPRLIRRGAFRCLFIQVNGRDVAYVFGGVLGDTYRGLQVSYDHDWSHLSLGNLAQLEIIKRLSEQGLASYDLGSELEYKARWAERSLETITVWVWKHE